MKPNKKYNSENGRKNMRLRGYDYSRAGLYFLTPVVQNRLYLFGEIVLMDNGRSKMILNDAGRMIEKWYWELENKYPDKRCHQMVVMPNHFHCIIENLDVPETDDHVPETDDHVPETDDHVGAPLRGRPNINGHPNINGRPNPKYGMDNQRYGATIGDVMGWFKTMTTNEYIRGVKQNGWKRFDGKLWQRNFYDHIIHNDKSYQIIKQYIIDNPLKWNNDKFYNK